MHTYAHAYMATCLPPGNDFGFYQDGRPSASMAASLIYSLTRDKWDADRHADLFKEVYVSARGLVRIVKVVGASVHSKAYVANATNRRCDAPGSWY